MGVRVWPVLMLIGSNIFMTFAWYGHLKFKEVALWKVIQEVITLTVFGVFSVYFFGDRLHWNHGVAFGCLVAGAFFMFHKF